MSSYLRPRRGKNATAISQLGSSAPLKRGEVFFEVPDAGVGTGLGKIKMGDGSTAYANLPYFLEQLDLDNAKIAFTDSNTADPNPYTTNTTLATAIAPTATVKTIFTNLKQLLVNHNAQLTQLNNEIDACTIFKSGTGWSHFKFTKSINGLAPSLIALHHDGGSAGYVAIWQSNYVLVLYSNGQFKATSTTYSELIIDNPAPYWSIGVISIVPISVSFFN